MDAQKAAELQQRIDALNTQINDAVVRRNKQRACALALKRRQRIDEANAKGLGENPFASLAERTFPRGGLWPSTSTAVCSPGTSRALFYVQSRQHPADEATARRCVCGKDRAGRLPGADANPLLSVRG